MRSPPMFTGIRLCEHPWSNDDDINSRHPGFDGLTVGPETPVWWDQRLFR